LFKRVGPLLLYQPIIKVATGLPVAAEALVRWAHPRRGLVTPDQFISLAERTGLIHALTDQVIRISGEQVASRFHPAHPERIHVNISPLSLRDENFARRLLGVLGESGFAPRNLVLEVTETAILHDPDKAQRLLEALEEMGIRIAIDDFGTGYSSLSRLKNLPVSEIKIDRSFIKDMLIDPDDSAIVKATIAMAHDLGIKVTAEGVETCEILDALAELGCDTAQGYYFSRPLEAEAYSQWKSDYGSGLMMRGSDSVSVAYKLDGAA
jgi:EAL domain-containing protein (putative c-di-GMP-specific phosphodiesterase class I)